MNSMTLPERIFGFLSQCRGRMYCDSCIQERMGLRWRQQVQLITATLAVTGAFRRELGNCCTCEQSKQVTGAIDGHAVYPGAKAGRHVRSGSRIKFVPGGGKLDASKAL